MIYAVTRAVVTGELKPGDPFPSVRSLSQNLKINPNTAHRIVAALIERGLLVVRPGSVPWSRALRRYPRRTGGAS